MTTDVTLMRILAICLVATGALFLALSLPMAGRIRSKSAGHLRNKWLVIVGLMGFFLAGCLFFEAVLLFSLPFPVELVTGSVFLGGAFFVYLIVNISHHTMAAWQKAEQALLNSEACFQVMFDSMDDAIIVQDRDTRAILGVNERACRMFGFSHEELRGVTLSDLSAMLPAQDVSLLLDEACDTGPVNFELLARNKDGRQFWVEVTKDCLVMENQSRLLLTIRDIDRRKHSEERLARLNDCFLGFGADPRDNMKRLTHLCGEQMGATSALFNRLDNGVLETVAQWNVPADFKLIDQADGHICSDVVQRGNGQLLCVRNLPETPYAERDPNVRRYKLQTYVGMPVRCRGSYVGSLCALYQKDFSPSDDDLRFMGMLAIAVGVEEERRLAAEELRKAHDELETRVVERTAELAAINEELLTDIAERKKAEEALWKSETILRRVFEAIPDMVAVLDRDLRIVHSNWQGGYEYVEEALRSSCPRCYDAYYPEQGIPCEECHARSVFQSGKPVTADKYNPRVGLLEVRAFPVFDDAGEVVMVVEYLRNITEHRRLEEELRRAHKLESLGVLAGGIAHDFNNLLTGILGNISMAKLTMAPGDRGLTGMDNAEKATLRARDLTQQLLTFSQGGAPVKRTASIEQIVMDSASFVLRGSNVKCEFAVPEAVWPVEVDEGQMNQVINNLIINADQSMPDGGIIETRIENLTVGANDIPGAKEGRYVRISIGDRGGGIPKENLQKIFDPYFTTKLKGSGLGLATVYSIMKSHDGHIRVESKVGEGSTFHLYLPASERDLPALGRPEEKRVAGSGRVLVMDDEEIIREVACGMLSHFGYEVAVCGEGGEALALYQEAMGAGAPFSAVIMDLTIPGGMGGKETMKRLLEIDAGAVGIVSSGYCNDPILARHRDYGFRGVVTKPYNMDELGNVLDELLNEFPSA